jgi:hypothetical protein
MAVIAAVFVIGLGAGLTAWWLQSETPVVKTPRTDEQRNAQTAPPGQQEERQAVSADEEIAELRARRREANPILLPKVREDLEGAERKYPADYRFPYERAKIFIRGVTEHDEPFELLFLAGQKAIDNGKTDEMLAELERDKDFEFRKLSRGHGEWLTLIAALSSKDKKGLSHHSH